MNDTFKIKQDWLSAVMASGLSPATKVYAYGVFKHMFGDKEESFPGQGAIKDATNLSTGRYYVHSDALEGAGFLEVTHRRGRSNVYRLAYPPIEEVGTHPQKREHPPTEEVTPTSSMGTNITKNQTRNESIQEDKKSPAVADTPPVDQTVRAESPGTTFANSEEPDASSVYAGYSPLDWRDAKLRGLTQEERDHIAKTSSEYIKAHQSKNAAEPDDEVVW